MADVYNLNSYTVAWICALPRSCGHNVAMACLPSGSYGLTPATNVLAGMRSTFPCLRFVLMVGIGGGIPSRSVDVRLGDVVVSRPTGTHGGVIQYDRGKFLPGDFERSGSLNKPPQCLLTAMSQVESDDHMGRGLLQKTLDDVLQKVPSKFSQPYEDLLFQSGYVHQGGSDCSECVQSHLVSRARRGSGHPHVHYGLIASGNQVMKDPKIRDIMGKKLGVLCFEMEAAGLMDHFPTLVVRGICDYCDSHKNKKWQGYASITAASYAKILLRKTPLFDRPDWRGRETIHMLNSQFFLRAEPISLIQNTPPTNGRFITEAEPTEKHQYLSYTKKVKDLEVTPPKAQPQKPPKATRPVQNPPYAKPNASLKNSNKKQAPLGNSGKTMRERNGWTELHLKSFDGDVQAVKRIIFNDPSTVHATDINSYTPLHRASWNGKSGVVKVLLSAGIRINAKNRMASTALHYAAMRGHVEIVRQLLSKGESLNDVDNSGFTALLRAAAGGHLAVVELLVARTDILIERGDQNGRTALHHAAKGGHVDTVHFLITKHPKLCQIADRFNLRPIHLAAKTQNGTLTLLLEQDSKTERAEQFQKLHRMAANGFPNAIDDLVALGRLNDSDGNGMTALHLAAREGKTAAARLLIARNADVCKMDSEGKTALHHAYERIHAAIRHILLDAGAIETVEDKFGKKPSDYIVL